MKVNTVSYPVSLSDLPDGFQRAFTNNSTVIYLQPNAANLHAIIG
jgi:hypothetical protein